jgi:formate hydrogenlyase transcriptional activator
MAFSEPGAPASSVLNAPDRMSERYRALLDVADSIISDRQLDELFHDLRRCLRPIVWFDFIALSLYDPAQRTVRLHLLETDVPHQTPPARAYPVDEMPTRVLLETGRPLYVPDLNRETRFPTLNDLLRAEGVGSYCMLPLAPADRFLGAVTFGTLQPNGYEPEDIEFMEQAAKQIAIAVENALNHEAAVAYQQQLARERDRLKLLLDINNSVVSQLRTDDLMREISATLRAGFGIDSVTLTDIATSAPPANAMASWCSIPLAYGGRTLGVLHLGSRRENAFGTDEVDLLTRIAGQIAIALDNALSYRRIEELNAQLAEEKVYLEDEVRSEGRFEEIIGRSPAMRRVLRQVETVAPTDSTVLICGETGTGKELIARAIHNLSARSGNAFVKLNCAAIPSGLLESEMFGHEKGAFTGALMQRIGRFELAHGGTVFLDEVAEIPLEIQPKLLRVLQEREFERLGSTRTLKSNVRLVAATNRDLDDMVQSGRFRADLFYRLNVFPITIPPLREHAEDIPVLVRYFVQHFARRMGKRIETIPSHAMEALVQYSWPGNVRELQNLMERAVILTRGAALRAPLRDLKPARAGAPLRPETLEEAERRHIVKALEESNWVVAGPRGAAMRLGVKRSTLQFRMRKLGIQRS